MITDTNRPNGAIYEYAFFGNNDFQIAKREELSKMAEPEPWNSSNRSDLDRLKNYIDKTFERCQQQNKIVENSTETASIFNTGLMTNNGEDIYGYFILNDNPPKAAIDPQKWKFKCYLKASDRRVTNNNFDMNPELATYGDHSKYHIDIEESKVISNVDHIFDDHLDFSDDETSRYPDELIGLGKQVLISLVNSSLRTALKKIKRNPRLVVPQFYRNQLMYLIPIDIPINETYHTMALAVECLTDNRYRINTIFTLDMAYKKARLVMKPESNWLIK